MARPKSRKYRILNNFGRLARHIRISFVRKDKRARNLLLDVTLSKCGATLKSLSLYDLDHYEVMRLTWKNSLMFSIIWRSWN